MTTTSTTEQPQVRAEPIVTLRGVSWQTYQALMQDVGDNRAWRIAYDQGILEIRMPLAKHEEPKRLLESFIEVVVDELGILINGLSPLPLTTALIQQPLSSPLPSRSACRILEAHEWQAL